uniref:Na_H_Exchanger domain-containing protein n=1 Tax=Parastrongyloides trichosuri TaxID=131310 RepID=A0A0N4ZYP2_PARTI
MKNILEYLFLSIGGYLLLVLFFEKNLFNPINNNETENIIISLYILWIFGLFSSYIVSFFKMAPLLGGMIIGVIFRNVIFLEKFLYENNTITTLIRDIGYVIILIRSGLCVDLNALKKFFSLCLSLGIISTIMDVMFLAFLCHYILYFPINISILFSFIISSVAPAIIVPVVIELKKNNIGKENGIPTIILANATVINIFCTTSFSILVSIFYGKEEFSLWKLKVIPIGIFIGLFVGILFGLIILNIFKNRKDASNFKKAISVMLYSLLIFYCGKYFENNIISSVGIISLTILLNYYWNEKDGDGVVEKDKVFAYGWNNLIEPLLFSMIGITLNLNKLCIKVVLVSLLIILLSIFVKWLAIFLMLTFSHLNYKERLYMAFSFTSKATVQAVLAPILASILLENNIIIESSIGYSVDELIIIISIISIILTAPLGHLLMSFFSNSLLRNKNTNQEIQEEQLFISNEI